MLLLPVQRVEGDGARVNQELAHALRERGRDVEWTDAETLEGIAQAAGPMGADPSRLAVAVFHAGEVRQVGDPLFGDLYRLAALVDAHYVVLPLLAYVEPEDDGGEGAAVVIEAAFLVPRTGRVLWQGIFRGNPGEPGSPALMASAAERLAARLVP